MAGFRHASHEQINVFEVDETYLFKHYFDNDDVFDCVKQYYNSQQYRFEVPAEDFEQVQSALEDHGYGLVVVDSVEEFVVVVEKYTAHPDDILKHSVIQGTVDGYNCFLLTDQVAVEQAIHEGATRLTETNLENPF